MINMLFILQLIDFLVVGGLIINFFLMMLAYFGFEKGETKNLMKSNISLQFFVSLLIISLVISQVRSGYAGLEDINYYIQRVLFLIVLIVESRFVLKLNVFSANFGFKTSYEGILSLFNLKPEKEITNSQRREHLSFLILVSVMFFATIFLIKSYLPQNDLEVFSDGIIGLLYIIAFGFNFIAFKFTNNKKVFCISASFFGLAIIRLFEIGFQGLDYIAPASTHYFAKMLIELFRMLFIIFLLYFMFGLIKNNKKTGDVLD